MNVVAAIQSRNKVKKSAANVAADFFNFILYSHTSFRLFHTVWRCICSGISIDGDSILSPR